MAKGRNKTISLTLEEGREYLDKVLIPEKDRPIPLSEFRNRTILGDVHETAELLPRESFNLIIADPPYNLTKEFHGSTFAKKDPKEYEDYTRRWLSAVIPLLKENGTIYVCCDWESSLIIGQVLGEFVRIRNRITWQREKGRGAKDNWKNSMEDIWYGVKGKEPTFNLYAVKQRRRVIAPYKKDGVPKDWTQDGSMKYRDTCPSNFWDDITVPFWSMPENTEHPTQKPEKLMAKLILASSNEGDVVFDPFLGSGTTSVTALKLKRDYCGCEINPRYALWAEYRLSKAKEDPRIQGYEDRVFWERNTKPEKIKE